MINAILTGIFKILTYLISLFLTPINLLITNFLPGLDSALSSLSSFFTYCFQYVGWILDSCFISSETVSLLIAIWVFKLTAPLLVYLIKLIVRWYNKLKL